MGRFRTPVAAIALLVLAVQLSWTAPAAFAQTASDADGVDRDGDAAISIRDERQRLLLAIEATDGDLRRTAETIAAAEGLPVDALYAMLGALDPAGTDDPAEIGRQLHAGAETLKAFLAERPVPARFDPEIVRFFELADQAVEQGALQAALALHDQARERLAGRATAVEPADPDGLARRLEIATVYARSARSRELVFDYLGAADDWAKALAEVARRDDGLAFAFALARARAFDNRGAFDGDNNALRRAIDLYRGALDLAARTDRAGHRTTTLVDLANALSTLGEREGRSERLQEAIEAYHAVLRDLSGDPLAWATTQHNLGLALWRLGELDGDPRPVTEAVAAYRAALEVRTRERVPLAWAATQNNLGVALWTLGRRDSGTTARLGEAVGAYRAALQVRTREHAPFDWAVTQNNLGLALVTLAERDAGQHPLEQAVVAFRAAIEVWTRKRAPLYWATTQINLGSALTTLGERETGTARLEEAVAALQAALEEWTNKRVPLNWADIQSRLGWALGRLGQRTMDLSLVLDGRERLALAWEAYKAGGRDNDAYFQWRLATLDRTIAELETR